MGFFDELSNMKFGEAYSEIGSVLFETGKEVFQEKKAELTNNGEASPIEIVEEVKDRIMFG